MSTPICPTCGQPAAPSNTKYGIRHDCCGLHSWDGKPLVSPATHAARKAAHVAFDKLWKSGRMSRGAAYKALAAAMVLPPGECHISLMSKEDAERVIEIAPTLLPARRQQKHTNFIGLNPW